MNAEILGNSPTQAREMALDDAKARIPVLLKLRHYQKSTLDLIEQALRTHGLMDLQRLPEWLQQGRLLLLVDGINELPSDAARRELAAFRREYRATTPMIFATRELMVGGDLEIGQRLGYLCPFTHNALPCLRLYFWSRTRISGSFKTTLDTKTFKTLLLHHH